ncbi:MAG TPA: Hpt domain-containing protein, partial [Anaeromyxobacteraceae bacterium]|nr:Hpt domain-containing protein [Anaeromyxobacteraceae bacterium]
MELAKYLGLFVSEASEHLAALGALLVRLEAAGGDPAGARAGVDAIFRHVHSLKGMAATMELGGIAALAHRAEDLVDVLRARGAAPDAAAVDVLLATADALTARVEAARAGASPEPEPELLERLARAAEGARVLSPGDPPPTSQAPTVTPSPEPAAPAPIPRRRVAVEVEVAASCPVPSVRAFLVVNKLARLGSVAGSTPAVADLKAGRLPERRLEVAFDTSEPLPALERALSQISDLARVALREEAGGVHRGGPHRGVAPR